MVAIDQEQRHIRTKYAEVRTHFGKGGLSISIGLRLGLFGHEGIAQIDVEIRAISQGVGQRGRVEIASEAWVTVVWVSINGEAEGATGGALCHEARLRPRLITVADAVVVARIRLKLVNQRFERRPDCGGLRGRLGAILARHRAVLIEDRQRGCGDDIDGD